MPTRGFAHSIAIQEVPCSSHVLFWLACKVSSSEISTRYLAIFWFRFVLFPQFTALDTNHFVKIAKIGLTVSIPASTFLLFTWGRLSNAEMGGHSSVPNQSSNLAVYQHTLVQSQGFQIHRISSKFATKLVRVQLLVQIRPLHQNTK